MIMFTEHSDRDLKRKEAQPAGAGKKAAAASMARPAGAWKKKKEAGSLERRVSLCYLFPNESMAEARAAGAGKKKEEATAGKKMEEATAEKKMEKASASESHDDCALINNEKKEGDSLFKAGEMLKLREELWEAEHLWRKKLVPGALDRWLKRKATQVPAVDKNKKKKKKVVRQILPNGYIDCIIDNPDLMTEPSDEEMAKCPEDYQTYAIIKVINAKNCAYQQALIDQYRAFGFAYDEKEVTDDDEEEEVVVKN